MTIYRPVVTEVTGLLSAPRLSSYMSMCNNNRSAALKLYAWNIEIGAAFFADIHYLEVGVRNTIHDALSKWALEEQSRAGRPPEPWYLDSNLPFQTDGGLRSKVRQALKHAKPDVTPPIPDSAVSPGKVVAELTFGFWWSLFAVAHNRTLWQPCLRDAFPGQRRGDLHTDLDTVRDLRNRIGHHEPIHAWDLNDTYQKVLGTAEKVSPSLAWWIDVNSRVAATIESKP